MPLYQPKGKKSLVQFLGHKTVSGELNKQKETDAGNKHSYGFGLNWDLLRKNNTNINFGVMYAEDNPAYNSRNYVREYFDVTGDKYQVFASRNKKKSFMSSLLIKF